TARSHHLEPRLYRHRRLAGSNRPCLDQPLSQIVGKQCDAFGLARRNHESVEPERLPAVVEAVEQSKMMAVQMHRLDIVGAVLAGKDDHAGARYAEERFALLHWRQIARSGGDRKFMSCRRTKVEAFR